MPDSVQEVQGRQHIMPTDDIKEHVCSVDCWCHPFVEVMCPSCDGLDPQKTSCYRCKGEGWIEAEEDSTDPDGIVIHNRIQSLLDGKE